MVGCHGVITPLAIDQLQNYIIGGIIMIVFTFRRFALSLTNILGVLGPPIYSIPLPRISHDGNAASRKLELKYVTICD